MKEVKEGQRLGEQRTAKEHSNQQHRRLFCLLLVTVCSLLAAAVFRSVWLCRSFPEREIAIDDLFGANQENLTSLTANGHKLTATANNTRIYYSLNSPIPVREVEYDVSQLSRENCWSYIDLLDENGNRIGQEGSVIMQKGQNYISFAGSTPTDQVCALDMLPVTLRAVSFTYTRFVLNPHARFIFLSFRSAGILLCIAVLTELVLYSILLAYRKNAHRRTSLFASLVLAALQCIQAGCLVWQYYTAGWEWYTMTYFLLVFVCSSLFLLVVERPDLARPGRFRRELPVLRILLLSVMDFACTEALYSDRFKLDKPLAVLGNVLVYALPYLVLWCVFFGTKCRRLAYAIPQIFWLTVAGINHYYFQYRSQAFEYSDLTMIGTFRNVAGTYKLNLEPGLFLVYVASAEIFVALFFENKLIFRRKSWRQILAGAAVVLFILCWLPANIPYVSLWNTNTATRHNGYAFSFLSYAQKSLQKPTPAGYSAKETQEMLEAYRPAASGTAGQTQNGTGGNTADSSAAAAEQNDEDAAVNIIVMMNEAFADLPETYGFDVDNDNLPYIHSLSGDNVKKGSLLVSVFGGTTADTEYEFLTGNSLSFLNGEAVPYTQYINSAQQSLARLLKNRGYSATAFHPYLASGYKRYKVYPLLDFDQFLASDNTTLPYTARLRSYISDHSDVQDLIDIYENREKYGVTSASGEPFFFFNVTMQNHGGYNSQVSAVDVTVKPTDPELANLSELQEYLSLTKATDTAFEELTEYFSTVKEKTIILMFGDHQPSMGEYVYKAMNPAMYEEDASLEEKEKKYTVPYILWANYTLPEGELPVTSPNYLRSFLLENAGLTPSAYDSFVSSVREEYPAMNRLGFRDADGGWHQVSEIDSLETLLDYKKAAYYNLFDHRHMDESLFN